MRAAIYLRQSKDTTGEGLAIDRQEIDCRKLAAERGWQIVAVLPDNDVSASSSKARPRYEELLRLIDAKQVDVVIAWAVDRLTRRLSELEDIIVRCERASVRVATVSGDLDLSTDAGRLVGRILASVAKGEVERKSARQRRAGRQAAESLKPPARRSFGYAADGGHQPDEAPALIELYDKILGGMSIVAATRWMNEHGHQTTTGKPWDRSSVKMLLLNPRNAGFRVYQREIVGTGTWTPIVSEEVWRAVDAKLRDPARKRPGVGSSRKWLGSGVFRCHCGSTCRVQYSHSGTRIYQCIASAHMSRSADKVDDIVTSAMVKLLRDPMLAERLAVPSPDTTALRDEARRLRLKLQQVENDYGDADGAMSFAMFQRVSGALEAKLAVVTGKLADAGSGSVLGMLLTNRDPGAAWLESDLATQQAAINAAVTVRIMPPNRSTTAFDKTAIRVEPKVA